MPVPNSKYILMFPINCLLCSGRSSHAICEACRELLIKIDHPCHRCGIPLETECGNICANCLNNKALINSTFAPFRYEGLIKKLIIKMKFSKNIITAHALGKLLAESLAEQNRPDALVVIPMHPKGLIKRGFNQAFEIAKPVAKKLDIPLHYTAIRKTRPTAPQSQLTQKQRQQNLRKAFKLTKDLSQYSSIAIIDDVITTGETLKTAAKLLKKAGIQTINAWAVAHA